MSCQKSFTIVKTAPVYRIVYWTMEETGFSNRVDKVSSLAMPVTAQYTDNANVFSATALGLEGQPALYGNGFRIAKGLPNQFILSGLRTTEASLGVGVTSTALREDGTGFSFCFWLKVDLLNTIVGIINYNRTAYFLAQLRWTSASCVARLRGTGTPQEDVVLPIPTAGVWTFYELFHDPTLGKMGCRINNATDYLTASAQSIIPSPSGSFTIIHNGFPGDFTTTGDATDCQDFTTDEVLIRMDARLTVAQRAYLYNGGAGRTWPIALP